MDTSTIPGVADTGAHEPPSGTNRLAVAAAVFGALGAFFIGIPLGLVALVQTQRSRQRGRAVALLALVLSCGWIALVVVIVTRGVPADVKRDANGVITRGGTLSLLQLRVGDCVDDLGDDAEVLALPMVPCTAPHQAEVYAIATLPDGAFPGDNGVETLSGDLCERELDQLEDLDPEVLDDPGIGLTWFQPRREDWERGDRKVACLVTGEQKRRGSIRHSSA
jgi:hypothetical protein